jgi:hypothetical protein
MIRRMIRASRRSGVVMLLAALLGAGPAHAAPVSLANLVVTEGGATWSLDVDVPVADVVSLRDASLVTPALADALDGFWHLKVGGAPFRPGPNGEQVTDATGTTIATATTTVAGLEVTLQFFLSRELPVARVLVTLRNPGAVDVTTQVSLSGNLGSDGDTTTEASSSGDAGLTDADRWVITSDGPVASDPVVSTVLFGPGNPAVQPRGAALAVSVFDLDSVVVSYRVRVPPGATRHLMFFTQLSPTPAAASAAIALFDDNQALAASGLLAGLDAAAQALIVNWTLGFPPVCADRTGC